MHTYEITPEFYIDAWDDEDAAQRMAQLLNWLCENPFLDIAAFLPTGCIRLVEGEDA